MAKVKYSREVLVSTAQYENTKVAISFEDDVDTSKESLEDAYVRIKKDVDQAILDEVVMIKFGETKSRRAEMERAVAKKLGITIHD